MVQAKELAKWTLVVIGIFGIAMAGVSIWTMTAQYGPGKDDLSTLARTVGDGPKLAVSAGVFSILIAASVCFINLDNKMHITVVAVGVLLILALSLSAVGTATKLISDLKTANLLLPSIMIRIDLSPVYERLRAVAIVSGLSAAVHVLELVFIGLSLR